MANEDNNQFFTWWQAVLLTVAFAALVIPVAFCATNFEVTIGEPVRTPTPAPTATPNPYFTILIEQAKANAHSQATDDEIRLRWNIHYMRRFWAWFAVPVGFIFIGLGLYIWGLYQHR